MTTGKPIKNMIFKQRQNLIFCSSNYINKSFLYLLAYNRFISNFRENFSNIMEIYLEEGQRFAYKDIIVLYQSTMS